jgi:cysteine-rich repeat protein
MHKRYVVGFWLLWVSNSGCVSSGLVPCGDKRCAVGSVCTETGQCVTQQDIDACVGMADGEICTGRLGNGVCSNNVCEVGSCGNAVVEAVEACDDGNRLSGDGCAADCKKTETCGDGVTDQGESCDDGNNNAVDGCDACNAQSWVASSLVGSARMAVQSPLSNPSAIAVDDLDNLYIADSGNARIRKVDSTGVITTVAGTGTIGYAGDGGNATSAQLANVSAIAVDGLGNLYIADAGNERIRRVDSAGIITTVAGNGTRGFAGDGSQATNAQLENPVDIALDRLGNLYIADAGSQSIRKVDVAGVITTVAGSGVYGYGGDGGRAVFAKLASPSGVAIDDVGNLYIADAANQRIRKVDSAGTITTVAGNGTGGDAGDGGQAAAANLAFPSTVSVDESGSIFVTVSGGSQRIRKVDSSGIITAVAGVAGGGYSGDGGSALLARLSDPQGIATDSLGNLYIADRNNHRVRKVDTANTITTIVGTGIRGFVGDGGSATTTAISCSGMAVDSIGNIFLADRGNNRIRKVSGAGIITTIAGNGSSGYGGDGALALDAQLTTPTGIAVDAVGNVYIADAGNHRIRKVDNTGVITTVAGNGTAGFSGDGAGAVAARLSNPLSVAVDAGGTLYIADNNNQRIRKVDTAGIITTVAGTVGLSSQGVAVDALGNLYIADTGGSRIRRVDTTGAVTTIAGTGTPGFSGDGGSAMNAAMQTPFGVAVDAIGNIYIADIFNQRIRKVDAAGVITTVAGGRIGGNGDGGKATSAELAYPNFSAFGVAADSFGNLYIGDAENQRIRKLDNRGIISTVVGAIDPEGVGPRITGAVSNAAATAPFGANMLVATGSKGAIEIVDGDSVKRVIGRYPQNDATGNLAAFRDSSFGTIFGVAVDPSTGNIYFTETSRHRIHVVATQGAGIDSNNSNTWTIATLANTDGTPGYRNGVAGNAQFREPRGLYFDPSTRTLYIVDTGNHAIRALDLATNTITTVVNTNNRLGFAGDGRAASAALLYQPSQLTRCDNGDFFIADTGNHRIRRIAGSSRATSVGAGVAAVIRPEVLATATITTVLGDGVATSSGEGSPASTFPVDSPRGLGCDGAGNLFVSSSRTIRALPANTTHIVDGSGVVRTIYGIGDRNFYPLSESSCLTAVSVATTAPAGHASALRITDACSGIMLALDFAAR